MKRLVVEVQFVTPFVILMDAVPPLWPVFPIIQHYASDLLRLRFGSGFGSWPAVGPLVRFFFPPPEWQQALFLFRRGDNRGMFLCRRFPVGRVPAFLACRLNSLSPFAEKEARAHVVVSSVTSPPSIGAGPVLPIP